MKQRPVPPQVEAEILDLGPVRLQAGQPGDALRLPALHLHDMGDGMGAPGVVRVDADRFPAALFGAGIVAVLLQRKGIAAGDEAVVRHRRIPGMHDPGQRIAHGRRIAAVEMRVMRQPHGENVVRMVGEDTVPQRGRAFHVALDPALQRRDMRGFARRHRPGGSGLLRRRQRLAPARPALGLAEQQHEIAAQTVRHRHVGIGGVGLFQPVAGVAPHAEIAADGAVPGLGGFGRFGRQREAAAIGIGASTCVFS